MKLKPTQKLILTILSESKLPLSFNEIFGKMEPSEQGLFRRGAQEVSGQLSYLSTIKYVKSEASYINSKNTLFWDLTDDGRAALLGCDIEHELETEGSDPLKAFDTAAAIMRESIVNALQPTPLPALEDKAVIIKTLGQLGALMSDDIRAVLTKAAVFINQFEGLEHE